MPGVPQGVVYILAGLFTGLGVVMLLWRPGPNCWIGIRLPWTFADRQIWDKSWQLGTVFVLGMGIGVMISFKLFFIALIHLVMLGILYPIYLYRRKYGTLRFWKDQGWVDYHPVVRCVHCGHYQKLRAEAELPVAVCEACGLICRSK